MSDNVGRSDHIVTKRAKETLLTPSRRNTPSFAFERAPHSRPGVFARSNARDNLCELFLVQASQILHDEAHGSDAGFPVLERARPGVQDQERLL